MARPEISLVIPIYNEEEVLPKLGERLTELTAQLDATWEVVFVDDGSSDKSLELLRTAAGNEVRYRVLAFSRNFGHQRAITAGVDAARGNAVVVMDADLQDPPEVVLEMIARWRDGFDVVYGRRRSRAGESFFKVVTAKIFYRMFASMIPIEVPLDTGDFRLMSRRVVITMRSLRETHRFVRGLVAWAGFRQTAVEYDRAARAAGSTKYPLGKMLGFALDGIASFSVLPLRAATYLGLFVGIASVLYGIAAVITYAVGVTVPGWTTTVVLVSFLFSVQLVMTGVLGEYVGRIYEQVKRRPLYVVAERINFRRGRRGQEVPGLARASLAGIGVTPPPPLAAAAGLESEALPVPSSALESAPTVIGEPAVVVASPPSSKSLKVKTGPPPLPPTGAAGLPSTSPSMPAATSPSSPPVTARSATPPPVKASGKPPPPLPTKGSMPPPMPGKSTAPPPVAPVAPVAPAAPRPASASKVLASTPPPKTGGSTPPPPAAKPTPSTSPPAAKATPSMPPTPASPAEAPKPTSSTKTATSVPPVSSNPKPSIPPPSAKQKKPDGDKG
jgi:dolichol-phosphate mannosyltransferase